MLLFNYAGLEVPSAAGEEMVNPRRDVPKAVGTISTTTISYLFILPALVKLRYSRSDVERPYRVPFGMAGAWICSILPTFWCLLATVVLLWPGVVRRRGRPERQPRRARLLPPATAV